MSDLQKVLERAIRAVEQQGWEPGRTVELRDVDGRLRLVWATPLVIKDNP